MKIFHVTLDLAYVEVRGTLNTVSSYCNIYIINRKHCMKLLI